MAAPTCPEVDANAINTGPRKSGKSTLLKQMKIVYGNGFSTEERIAYRAAIYQNLLEEVQAVILAMYKLSIEPVDVQNRVLDFPRLAAYILTR